MAILAIARDTLSQVVDIVRIDASTSTVAEVSAAGYILAQNDNIEALNNGPFQWLASDFVLVYCSDGWVLGNISANFESIVPNAFSTTVVGAPVSVGNLAVFASTGGNIGQNAATAINGGNIQAGLSGTAGTLASFPAAANNGSLILSALNAGGAFNTTIRNSAMAQSTVYSLPDIGAATGGIVVSTAAVRMKSVAAAAAAGGAAAQSFTDAFCTAASNVIGNWNTQANAASVLKIVPANGSFVVTSSADAGAGTFNYVIMK